MFIDPTDTFLKEVLMSDSKCPKISFRVSSSRTVGTFYFKLESVFLNKLRDIKV